LLARLQKKGIALHAAAHITGGGFEENVPRVLPGRCAVQIQRGSWKIPAVFHLIQKGGKISEQEMFRVFNMGIGMVLVVPRKSVKAIRKEASRMKIPFFEIGRVVDGKASVTLV
jgi:phosphoribosylformylglycinamidine cyclo-ligase